MEKQLPQYNNDLSYNYITHSIQRLHFDSLSPYQRRQELLKALAERQYRTARALLLAGARVDLSDEYAAATLQMAHNAGHWEFFGLLIRASAGEEGEILKEKLIRDGPNILAALENGYTSLHEASRIGHVPLIKFLLDNDADIEAKVDNCGNTPLMMALFFDQLAAAYFLLERGANLEARSASGRTALLHVSRSRIVSVEYVLSRGADITVKDKSGKSALSIAASCARADIVQVLLDSGADIEAKDLGHRTAIHSAVEVRMSDEMESAQALVVKTLLNNNANIESRNAEGLTPLQAALDNSIREAIDILVFRGAKLDVRYPHGVTPLMKVAAFRPDAGIVKLLLSAGVDVHARDNSGQTALVQVRRKLDRIHKIDPERYELNQIATLLARTGAT